MKMEEMQQDIIYSVVRRYSIRPNWLEVTVYNRNSDNVIVHRNEMLPRGYKPGMPDPRNITAALPTKDIEEIISIIQTGSRLFDSSELEESEVLMRDGEEVKLYFNDMNGREVHISKGNLFCKYAGFGPDTKAGEIIRICNAIEDILKRNNLAAVTAEL